METGTWRLGRGDWDRILELGTPCAPLATKPCSPEPDTVPPPRGAGVLPAGLPLQLGHAPKPLSSRERIVLSEEWDKRRASPWKPRRSVAPSSAASSSVISSDAYTGTRPEPLLSLSG